MNRILQNRHMRSTLVLALPLIGTHVARMAIGVADTVMIGWYGVIPLAALILATSLYIVLFLFGAGFGFGVMGVIASALAREDETEVRRATRMALWLSIGYGVLAMPLMWWSEPLMLALQQDPEVSKLAQDYLRIAGWGMFATLIGATLNSYLAALDRAQISLWITVAALPMNVGLNWLLIFGNWGAPEMGVRGAAWASLSVQILTMIALMIYAAWAPISRRFQLFSRFWKPDVAALRAVFSLGLPIGVATLAEAGMFTGTNFIMGLFGTTELAAQGIALQIISLAFMVPLGLANAATVKIGHAQGRRDGEAMHEAAMAVLVLATGFAIAAAALFLFAGRPLVAAFLDPTDPAAPAILSLGTTLLIWAGVFQLADCAQVSLQGMLRGVQDTRIPSIIATIAYWVIGLPVGYVLALPLGYGPQALWLGLLVGLMFAASFLGRRFFGGIRADGWHAPSRSL